jgi:hypothetical protein
VQTTPGVCENSRRLCATYWVDLLDIVDQIREVGMNIRENGGSVDDLLAFLDDINASPDPDVFNKWTTSSGPQIDDEFNAHDAQTPRQ